MGGLGQILKWAEGRIFLHHSFGFCFIYICVVLGLSNPLPAPLDKGKGYGLVCPTRLTGEQGDVSLPISSQGLPQGHKARCAICCRVCLGSMAGGECPALSPEPSCSPRRRRRRRNGARGGRRGRQPWAYPWAWLWACSGRDARPQALGGLEGSGWGVVEAVVQRRRGRQNE